MAVAMSEMMQRIKTGNIQLKPVKSVIVQLSLLLLELLKTVLLFLFFLNLFLNDLESLYRLYLYFPSFTRLCASMADLSS